MKITHTVYKNVVYDTQWDSFGKETKYSPSSAGVSLICHWCPLRKDPRMFGTETSVATSHKHPSISVHINTGETINVV